jgi:predicted protein tyrosine phosphatase
VPNVLFVCGKARKRSPTAAEIAARDFGVETDFAGLSADADERLGAEQIGWADIVVVMEKRQLARLKRQFGSQLRGRKLACLDIPDRYAFMDPALVALVQERLQRVLTRQV